MLNEQLSTAEPWYYGTPRVRLAQYLPEGRIDSVLEVGCGSGATLSYLRAKFGVSHAMAIEANSDAAELALKTGAVDEVLVGDVDTHVSSLVGRRFDVIVASHVLEHLFDPWKTARSLAALLRPGGRLVGAMPNVRHASVTVPLVFGGRFSYTSAGIMDWTHIRFFTRQGMFQLLDQAGLKQIQVDPEIQGWKSKALNVMSAGLFRDFAAYAFTFCGVRGDDNSPGTSTPATDFVPT
jgi:2-polyprenyl-3-methyl-5-hydroxy-6-metoxy-1,4-benzoquinol methylase